MIINVDMIYPVGSIYMNINLVDPSILFGGTWERIQARYLMGAGKPSKNSYDGFGQITDSQVNNLNFNPATLGEIAHKLTISEMPAHTHGLYTDTEPGTSVGGWGVSTNLRTGTGLIANQQRMSATGGNGEHNNLPPTLVVYMWKRTA